MLCADTSRPTSRAANILDAIDQTVIKIHIGKLRKQQQTHATTRRLSGSWQHPQHQQ